MRKRNSKKTNGEEDKKKGERKMGQVHDQPGREHPERRNARKQSNGPGPVTIRGCAPWGLHRPGWSIGAPPVRSGDPSPRAWAHSSSLRLHDVSIGPAHVVLLLYFSIFFSEIWTVLYFEICSDFGLNKFLFWFFF
jgi:hypothetical protein